jgi:uncharacterized protein (TIRG00374 family)
VSVTRKSIIQFVVFLAIGILLVWLMFRQVAPHMDDVILAFQKADYFWVIISLLISLVAHFLRAYRWNYLLNPLGYKVSLLNSNCYVLICYFFNYGIPRMGEVSRCTFATKYDKVPFEVGLGTVITERIVDTFVFLFISVITLFIQFSSITGVANKYIIDPVSKALHGLTENPLKLTVLIIIAAIFIIGFFVLRKRMASVLRGKLGNIIKGFVEGIGSIRKLDRPIMFVVLSLAIWALYLFSLFSCFFAISGTAHLTLSQALTLLLFGTLGVIVTPGGIGAYQAILTGVLTTAFMVDVPSAFALPWLSWGSQFVMLVILGIISLIVLPIANRNKNVVS